MNNSEQQGNRRIGKWMMFSAWLLGFAMLMIYFNYFLESEQNPNQSVYSRLDESGMTEVILQRNRYGHYVSNGKINGRIVQFMLSRWRINNHNFYIYFNKLNARPRKRQDNAGLFSANSLVVALFLSIINNIQ